MVARKFREDVMTDMSGTDVVVKEIENAIRAIDCAERTFDPGPITVAIVWKFGIRMLQPRVPHEPSIRHTIWEEVAHGNSTQTIRVGSPSKACKND
jgi:hypothetical protein